MRSLDYERDGAAIYDASFATIRSEADLSRVPPDLEPVVVRMIHACGDETTRRVGDEVGDAGRQAAVLLAAGEVQACRDHIRLHESLRCRERVGPTVLAPPGTDAGRHEGAGVAGRGDQREVGEGRLEGINLSAQDAAERQ